MATRCRTCSRLLHDAKGRKSLTGFVYTTLYELALERISPCTSSAVHDFLSQSQSYLCKSCHSTLTKFANIKKNLDEICSTLQSALNPGIKETIVQSATPHRDKRLETDDSIGSPAAKRHCGPKKLFTPPTCSTTDSPGVSVAVWGSKRKTRYFHLSKSLKRLGKYVGRGKKSSIVTAIMSNPQLREHIGTAIAKEVQKELKEICSDEYCSILRMKYKVALERFTWDRVWQELENKAPTLLKILSGGASSNNIKPAICTCASILLKLRNPKVNVVQAVVSVVLKAGHANIQVFNRLQKMQICLSHKSTVRFLDEAAEEHDEKVWDWRESLVKRTIYTGNNASATATFHEFSSDSLDELLTGYSTPPGITSIEHGTLQEDEDEIVAPPYSPVSVPSLQNSPQQNTSTPIHTHTSQNSELSQHQQELSNLPTQPQSSVAECNAHQWKGFVVVGDNIDKTVRARHQTLNSRNRSLHYFNSYAVLDRRDLSHLSEHHTLPDLHTYDVTELLPSPTDFEKVLEDFAILVGRMLTMHVPGFESYKCYSIQHIQHRYYAEMRKKSDVVPLGIILKNENKIDEMVGIMSELHQYVPSTERTTICSVSTEGEETQEEMLDVKCHRVLFAGDQLTVKRARSARAQRNNSEDAKGRLQGFVPVAQDWHAGQCFLEVVWKRLYNESAMDKGTLQQLRHLINRTNVPPRPKNNMNSADDFIQVVLIGHVIAVALTHFGMQNLDDVPTHEDLQKMDDDSNATAKQRCFHQALMNMLRPHINLFTTNCFGNNSASAADRVRMYACELLSLGLLYSEFKDSIREGDGERVFLCWKFFLPIFKADRKNNYAIEAVTYIAESTVLLPPRLREQLLWSRFINTTGKNGGNIAADLHMEHLNRTVKEALGHQFSNLHPHAILRTGKICGMLDSVCNAFDKESSVRSKSTHHTASTFTKDLNKIIDQLVTLQVFTLKPGRFHRKFSNLESTLTTSLHMKKEEIVSWLRKHILQINL